MNMRQTQPIRSAPRRAGLTLLELTVVLAILVTLTAVVVQSTDQLIDPSRREASVRLLSELDAAVLGAAGAREPDGTPLVTGFVADIGRRPLAVGAAATTQLVELWENAGGLPTFTLAAPAGDAEVRVGAGWRGPYLRLPLGAAELRDGWGRPLELLRADGVTELVSGDALSIARSLGSDELSGGTGYGVDLDAVLERSASPAVPARDVGSLAGSVSFQQAGDPPLVANGGFVVVRVYGPREGVAATLAQAVLPVGAEPPAFIFNGLPIGPRVVRAYQVAAAPASEDEELSGSAIRSAVVRVVLTAGGQSKDLLLR